MDLSFIALSVLIASAAAQMSGSLSLLSYDVGSPSDRSCFDEPDLTIPLISSRLSPYNIINVQDDFELHDMLYADDSHPYRTPTSGGLGTGSGLNTLSDFPYIDLNRVEWFTCNHNSDDIDCITPKGFTFARIQVRDGFWLDLYNLHTDAGDEEEDVSARGINLYEILGYIYQESAGMPVVLMGNTNVRYTGTAADTAFLREIIAFGFIDAWVNATRNGVLPGQSGNDILCGVPFACGTTQAEMVGCEVVDKILVRDATTVSFESVTFTNENDAFRNCNGPLSDHYPVSSVISWTLSPFLRLANYFGGTGGTFYNDITILSSPTHLPSITSLTIWNDGFVAALSYTAEFSNGTTNTVTHGGQGGRSTTLTFGSGEYVTNVQACEGTNNLTTQIFFTSFTTNLGRVLAGGSTTSNCMNTPVPTDPTTNGAHWGLVGFWGRSGPSEINRLGAIWGAVY